MNISKFSNVFQKHGKVFLAIRDRIYDGSTGELVDLFYAKKHGVIIEYTNTSPHIKTARKISSKYVYKSKKENMFFVSPTLTTPYIFDVISDYYGTTSFIIREKAFIIAFFGNRIDYIVSTDESAVAMFLEKTFQGVDYTEYTTADVLKLVKPDETKKIAVVAGIFSIGIIGFLYFIYNEFFYTPPMPKFVAKKPPPPVAPVKVNQDAVNIAKTQTILSYLFKPIKPYQAIKTISFDNDEIIKVSLFPDLGYKLTPHGWYEKNITIPPPAQTSQGNSASSKPVKQCFDYLSSIGTISSNQGHVIVFDVKRDMNVKDLSNMITNLYGCPIAISGSIGDIDLLDKVVNLKITLYTGGNMQ
ncbi:MAG: hypothetical protein ACP5MB_05035 [bacterium]